MLRFSCADYTFPLLERRPALQLLRLLDFDFVDLGLFARNPHCSPGGLICSPLTYKSQLQADLASADLQVSDIFLQIGVEPADAAANDPDALVRARSADVFAHALDLCVSLGCTHLTGLPGVFHRGVEEAEDKALAIDEARRRIALCSQACVRYAIEPHIDSLCPDVAQTWIFLDAVPGLSLTLDYGHFVAPGEPSERIHALLPFASHVHMRCAARGLLQAPLSKNETDFVGMLTFLSQLDYSGFLALEYVWTEWQGCNRVDNLSETVLLRNALQALINASEETAHV